MINIRDLSFAYKKQSPLFNQLSLDLPAGSITGLLGKNGAGKTTLLKLIIGLRFANTGYIDVMGYQPKQRKPSFLANVLFVPEEFYLPSISIKSYVSANSGFYPNFDRAMMDRLLNQFELSPERQIHKLSYGQKKKFLICFTLATKCKLLILDEPTNGLDIPSKGKFRQIMAGALDESQLVIISTHQVKDVENLIDKIIILDDGKVIMHKEVHEIASQLQFATSTSTEEKDVLYSELAPGGYKIITQQVNGNSSIDIELLFNAITQGTKLFGEHENK